jgi:diguanylate cyclase (GGDEF)-like protein
MLEWLGHHMERRSQVGLVLVDLDGFKDVNTLYGYPAGDAVLCRTARTLEACVRSGDMVARLGGDEFAVLTLRADKVGLEALCERVLAAVRSMPRGDAANVALTASLGWALYPDDAQTIDDLVANADFCVRAVKLAGKDRVLSAQASALA